ncbi:hypothetical protein, partial [Caminibacter sp.]
MDMFQIIQAIENVKHPAINASLTTLGLLQDVDVDLDNKKVMATFVWPFANIPIRDMLIQSVENAIKPFGLTFEYNERLMTEDERNKFLEL